MFYLHFPRCLVTNLVSLHLYLTLISVTSTIPFYSPPYSVPLAHQEAFRQEIENLLALGIIEPSTSLWSSSLMPIKKKDGGIRLVIDYRKLNDVTVHNPFSMPSIDDVLAHMLSFYQRWTF